MIKNTDLSILVQDTTIYLRVAGLVKTPSGFLFEKSKKGYIFAPGGKIKLGESSKEAMIREMEEEIGMKVGQLTLRSILENFYTNNDDSSESACTRLRLVNNEKVQEICFVYEIQGEFTGAISSEFIEVSLNEIDNYDVRPRPIVNIIKSPKKLFQQIIIK